MNLIDLIDELGDMTLNFYANVMYFFFLRYIFRSNDTNMFIFISLGNGIL